MFSYFEKESINMTLVLTKSYFTWKCNLNSSKFLQEMNIFFFNINYFHQFFWTFWYFLSYKKTCHHKTDNVRISNLQTTSDRLFNNCIKLYWYWISSSWNVKGRGVKSTQTLNKLPSKRQILLGFILYWRLVDSYYNLILNIF